MTAEKIIQKQSMLLITQKIFNYLEDYLKEQGKRLLGQKPTVLTLSNIKSVKKVGRTGLQLISANISSNAGSFMGSIAIKRFQDKDEFNREVTKSTKLHQKLNQNRFSNVKTPRIILKLDKTIVYEGIIGKTFDDSPIKRTKKNYFAGKALAVYHTAEKAKVNFKRYKYLIKRSLNGIPIPQEKKNKYITLGNKNLKKNIAENWSGTAAFGDFHSENIMFETRNNNHGSQEPTIITWLIDPEFSENFLEADRMEDIATFYIFPALELYKEKHSMDKILKELTQFVKGYNSQLARFGSQLRLYYGTPYDKVFLFHLGLNAFIQAYYLSLQDPEDNIDKLVNAVGLGKQCWRRALQK